MAVWSHPIDAHYVCRGLTGWPKLAVQVRTPTRLQPATINYQPSTINYQLSTINYQPSTINYLLTTIHYQLATINYRRPTIDYQLSAIMYQLSTINDRLPLVSDDGWLFACGCCHGRCGVRTRKGWRTSARMASATCPPKRACTRWTLQRGPLRCAPPSLDRALSVSSVRVQSRGGLAKTTALLLSMSMMMRLRIIADAESDVDLWQGSMFEKFRSFFVGGGPRLPHDDVVHTQGRDKEEKTWP